MESHDSTSGGTKKKQQLLDIIGEHCLTQVVDIPMRNDKTLDLLFTNFPSPVNRVKGMPPIGKADHDIVYVEYDIKAKRLKQLSRKIYLYKHADMVGLKDHMTQFKYAYLFEDHSHISVNDMWVKFKTGSVVVDFLFIVTPIVGVCNCSMFCCTLLYVYSSIAIILMGKKELIALLNLSSWCLVMVERLFLAVPLGCLQFVIVVFLIILPYYFWRGC